MFEQHLQKHERQLSLLQMQQPFVIPQEQSSQRLLYHCPIEYWKEYNHQQ